MPTKDGGKSGGRKKGTPNKRTEQVKELLEKIKCSPIEGMAKIALSDVPCSWCEGNKKISLAFLALKLNHKMDVEEAEKASKQKLNCILCDGTGKEKIGYKLRGDMLKELAQYIAPKRKAIEIESDALNEVITRIDLSGKS